MLGVAACCGIAVGAGLGLVIRRDRGFQLLALGLLSLALAVAFLIAGAALPALGALLTGVVAELFLLAPTVGEQGPEPTPLRARGAWHLGAAALAGLAALAAVGVLLGAGFASRGQLLSGLAAAPSVGQVGHQLVMGTGVALLAVAVLAAATVVGGAAISQRDQREAAEERAQQSRGQRMEAQQRRRQQREAARRAARAARRGR